MKARFVTSGLFPKIGNSGLFGNLEMMKTSLMSALIVMIKYNILNFLCSVGFPLYAFCDGISLNIANLRILISIFFLFCF